MARRGASAWSRKRTIRGKRLPCHVTDHLTDEWRASQRQLNELERQYATAMLAFFRGEGPPPPDELKVELQALRRKTEDLLRQAIEDIDRRMLENERKLDAQSRPLPTRKPLR